MDVSAQSLLRRLGPARWQHKPTPERVIDWAAIQPFGETEEGVAPEVRLRTTNQRLERLRPGELADLLEDLMRPERQKLLDSLTPEEAADALEEMDPEELASLLPRGRAGPGRRARSARWSRTRPPTPCGTSRAEERDEILAAMDAAKVAELGRLLGYPEDEAGGFMTTALLVASLAETVGQLAARLAATMTTVPTSSTRSPWSMTTAGWSGTCPCCSCWSTRRTWCSATSWARPSRSRSASMPRSGRWPSG